MTPRPRSRAVAMYFSTTPDCLTPSAAVGSSRISTRAPKYTARAMATDWRWPPDRVPMGWSRSSRTMPMFRSSVSAVCFIPAMSRRRTGHTPRVSSEPRKKLRHTGIRGTVARSW
ncbi:protein of unknown function DUF1602 [Actinobacteria bacterium OK074]|nr:protein of unknown function DUF1602 [Actinobacteria bacterium OK074]